MTSRTLTIPETGNLGALSDARLMQLARDLSADRRVVDAAIAAVTGELARRSDLSLGHEGLAVRVGARTVEKLVSKLTGVSGAEARSLVTVATAEEWARPVTQAVATGEIGVATAAAIQNGLGEPNADISAEQLTIAAGRLAADDHRSPEDASKKARQMRDDLDAEGVVDREKEMREKRYLRVWKREDGMTRIDGLLDPESAALVTDAFDRITMPRRGGPRFVDNALEHTRETSAGADTRTIEQVMVDGLVQIVTVAAGADDGMVFGVKAPAVRVHVRASDVIAGTGAGHLEGQSAAISIGTVQRLICRNGTIPILFDDDGRAVNVGREQRPFTSRQRIGIAARDGGCMGPECDRPPSWTEAHHCEEWGTGGATDIDNGISLCRHCHMWLHNTGRWITFTNGEYLLHSPDGSPPVALMSKHPLQQAA